jgi:hypothetical protein
MRARAFSTAVRLARICVCPNLVSPPLRGNLLPRQHRLDDLAFWHAIHAAQEYCVSRTAERHWTLSDQAGRLV